MTIVTELLCEYRPNPLGIDVTAPRLSWQIRTQSSGAHQTAYRILAASEPERLSDGKADLWDSGKVASAQSVHVVYDGQPLTSRQRVYWNVTVWDDNGSASQSSPAWFEIGLLRRDEWSALWVGAGVRGVPEAPFLRHISVKLSLCALA